VAQGRFLAATFHPELTGQTDVHREMLRRAGLQATGPAALHG
jgi:glutamine amidotransferase PdxT